MCCPKKNLWTKRKTITPSPQVKWSFPYCVCVPDIYQMSQNVGKIDPHIEIRCMSICCNRCLCLVKEWWFKCLVDGTNHWKNLWWLVSSGRDTLLIVAMTVCPAVDSCVCLVSFRYTPTHGNTPPQCFILLLFWLSWLATFASILSGFLTTFRFD